MYFPVLLSRMYILCHLGGIVYEYLLDSFYVKSHLILRFLCLLIYFCPDDLFIGESSLLKSCTITHFFKKEKKRKKNNFKNPERKDIKYEPCFLGTEIIFCFIPLFICFSSTLS